MGALAQDFKDRVQHELNASEQSKNPEDQWRRLRSVLNVDGRGLDRIKTRDIRLTQRSQW